MVQHIDKLLESLDAKTMERSMLNIKFPFTHTQMGFLTDVFYENENYIKSKTTNKSLIRPPIEPNLFVRERTRILSPPQQRYKRITVDLREVEAAVPCRCLLCCHRNSRRRSAEFIVLCFCVRTVFFRVGIWACVCLKQGRIVSLSGTAR